MERGAAFTRAPFRSGVASEVERAWLSSELIKTLLRWRSDVYHLHIDFADDTVLNRTSCQQLTRISLGQSIVA